jgi:hypothetical protein
MEMMYSRCRQCRFDSPYPKTIIFELLYHSRKTRKIKKSVNRKEDETKLDYAQLAIREIVALGDTVNGVRVHFNDTARYESFVRVLNICLEEGMVPYVPYKKDIWIFNRIGSVDEGKRPQYSFCGMHGPRTHARSEGLLPFPLHYNYDKRLWPIFLTLTILAALSLRRSLIS